MSSQGDQRHHPPSFSQHFGLKYGDRGTQTSRTMMLAELEAVFGALPADAGREEILAFIIESNGLNKKTGATRKLTAQRLSELYGLNPKIPVFRVLRSLWEVETSGRPLLAFLCAYGRDPLIRMAGDPVLRAAEGETVTKQQMEDSVRLHAPGRFNDNILNKIARNAGSSWTQSGHLRGRAKKARGKVTTTPACVAFALLFAASEGLRGARALDSVWCRLLDRSQSEIIELAGAASRAGILDFKKTGDIIQFGFSALLTLEEREMLHEQA